VIINTRWNVVAKEGLVILRIIRVERMSIQSNLLNAKECKELRSVSENLSFFSFNSSSHILSVFIYVIIAYAVFTNRALNTESRNTLCICSGRNTVKLSLCLTN
jgi:hypothetical protein